MNVQEKTIRENFKRAQRVVVKVGTRVLVEKTGRPNQRRIDALATELAELRRRGVHVALVTSGAVGAGIEALGLKTRPKTLPELQMAAAVGQARLMARYEKPFAKLRCKTGQILLTYDDLRNRERHLNVRNTVNTLFQHGIVPIINENDVVSVNEIKVGDNDVLAALSAIMIDADALILLSTTNGFRATLPDGRHRKVSFLEGVRPADLQHALGKGSEFSTGGMSTKLMAAQKALEVGIPSVIADGRKAGIIGDILSGKACGTLIATPRCGGAPRGMSSRKRWIAYFNKAAASLVVDDGAARALIEQGKSLLPIGIKELHGTFSVGETVQIKNCAGEIIARGLTDYSSADIERIMGHKTNEISRILGTCAYEEVIHRDNLAILKESELER